MTISKLEKEVRFLKIYSVMITLLLGGLVITAFKLSSQKTKFGEID